MANNVDAPFGLRPVKGPTGEVRMNYYTVSSASARIFEGDLVELSSGLVIKSTSTLPTSVLGVAAKGSGAITGALTGFPVYDDPDQIFSAQVNNGTSAVATSSFGTRCAVVQGSGSTNSNTSGVAVDAATTSTSYPVLVLRQVNRPDNLSGAYLECEVKILNQTQQDI